VACLLAYVGGLRNLDLTAVLYVGRFAALKWNNKRSCEKPAASMLAVMVLLQDASFSAFAVFERKNLFTEKLR
jgi:hypothetical protein